MGNVGVQLGRRKGQRRSCEDADEDEKRDSHGLEEAHLESAAVGKLGATQPQSSLPIYPFLIL